MNKSIILYFVKYPDPGKVKTRLATSIGDQEAADIYSEVAIKNFQEIKKLSENKVDIAILFDPPEREREMNHWLSGATYYWKQEGEGLGQRLENAFSNAFDNGYQKVIAFGSDTLDFNHIVFTHGLHMLETRDCVLGPAEDGGYYAIGLKEKNDWIFKDISWSTEKVCGQTEEKLKKNHLKYGALPKLIDLDDRESFEKMLSMK